ncbi:MAG: hypothetical protein PHR96_03520 [Clostridia bacterium]|nr:hypothetical protein [Clostridia bacterium]
MKKTAEGEAKVILSKLTGHENMDKKLLISSIQNLRSKKNRDEDIIKLGRKLYEILLENGLNESEIINPIRLLDKVDGMIYQKQYEQALELIEVLDSTEPCPPVDEKGEKIYYLSNFFEASILWQLVLNPITEKLNWAISPRNTYLKIKAQIMLSLENFKESEKIANEILKFNPVSFDANIILADIYKKANAEKFKKYLFKAYNVCYNTGDLKIFLHKLSAYYEMKKDFVTAYAVLYVISFFDNITLVEKELDRLIIEINKNRIDKFTPLTVEEINRIMTREKIPFYIKSEIFKLICEMYYDILVEDYNNEPLVGLCKSVLKDISRNSPNLVKDIEKLAKKAKNEKK